MRWSGSCPLQAFRWGPKSKPLKANFDVMMTHFHGPDKDTHNEVVRARMSRLAQEDADREEFRRQLRIQAASRLAAALRIQVSQCPALPCPVSCLSWLHECDVTCDVFPVLCSVPCRNCGGALAANEDSTDHTRGSRNDWPPASPQRRRRERAGRSRPRLLPHRGARRVRVRVRVRGDAATAAGRPAEPP